jgi:hypothetical protein
MGLRKMAADEAAAAVGMKSRAANDRVGRKVEARSVIVTTREGSFDASFGSVFKRTTVSTVIHNVEAEINKLQLIRERHSAVKQVQVMERESLDFVPAELVDVKLDKISPSSTNPLNQGMRVELKRSTMFHGIVVDPVDQLLFFNDSSQTVVVGIANVCRRF